MTIVRISRRELLKVVAPGGLSSRLSARLPASDAVLHADASGKVIGKASSECDGKPLRGPNDLTPDTNGGFYFTDPGGSRTKPIATVHYVDPQAGSAVPPGDPGSSRTDNSARAAPVRERPASR